LCWRQHEAIYYHVLKDKSVKKIILKRKNQLHSFVSLLRARKTGEWVVYNDEKLQTKSTAVKVDLDEYEDFIKKNLEYYQEINELLIDSNQSYFELSYEDLFKLPSMEKLLAFLKTATSYAPNLHPGTKKINGTSFAQLIENFDELAHLI